MRLNISTQPISTRRSPRNGSRPVVSVSRIISRMVCSREPNGESGSPPRHFNSLGENVADSGAHGINAMRCIHHEIRAFAFFGVWQLPLQDGIEFFLGHVVAGENALALNFRRRGHYDDRIDPLLAAGLE